MNNGLLLFIFNGYYENIFFKDYIYEWNINGIQSLCLICIKNYMMV